MNNVLPTLKKILSWFWKGWIVVSSIVGSFVLAIFLLIVIAVAASDDGGHFEQPASTISKKRLRDGGSDVIAVVNMTGPIFEDSADASVFGSTAVVSSKRMVELLKSLAKDDEVDAVILRINSPGGTVVASDDIYNEVKNLRKSKPVIASMSDTAASGGYYIAAGANKIVANPATITGSIGVIAQLPELTGLYEKIGVDMRTMKSGEFKDIGSPSREMTVEEREIFQSILTDTYDQFVDAIVSGRNMPEDKVRELADGRIYSGKQAKEAGLIDELGNMDFAIGLAEDEADIHDAQVYEYGNQSFLETLFAAKFNVGPLSSMNNLVAPQGFKVYYLMEM